MFYDKPLRKFERLLETYLDYAPQGLPSFLKAMPLWLREKLWTREQIQKELDTPAKVLFTEHHESHAASAFFPSPFESAAVLTIDGVGEWATSSYGAATEIRWSSWRRRISLIRSGCSIPRSPTTPASG